jgi:hypothetical protein
MQSAGLTFGATRQGVMVQIYYAVPADPEWDDMLTFTAARRSSLRAFLAVARGGIGPTSKQRQRLAEVLKAFPLQVPFALMSDSRVNRGVLTAINWITGRGNVSRAFPVQELDPAFDFLKVEMGARGEVRDLMKSLEDAHRGAIAGGM